ncbi:uncharacterized protein LOC117793975 [Drosophila innubila]|uniref:uncharacterized protein LOC117793975 n=1 Tax=Drosophila innubila TaxID=198719 RepID=UPI00148B7352|nr:uncharacterized protein LOC117793975 [Drosophila innubila]
MLGKHTRLSKILFVIIFVKVFILLVLLCLNTSDIQWRSHSHGRRAVLINDLLIDRREAPSLEERLKLIREEMPSFPLEELLRRPRYLTKTNCAVAPDFMNIEYHNEYWQVLHNVNFTFYFFGAYYDDRKAVPKTPLVRLLSMTNHYGKENELKYPVTYCQLWYKNRPDPVIVEATDHKIVWIWGGASRRYYPTLISCPLAKSNGTQEVPEMVSLVADRCDRAKNLLRVVHELDEESPTAKGTTEMVKSPPGKQSPKMAKKDSKQEKPLRFMVCLKAMDFPYIDMSWRLIEWLELLRLLGVDKVVFYDAQMHANMTRVLDDYKISSPGFVEVRPMSLGRGEPHSPRHFHHYALDADGFNRILNEMIPYNDCYYRNMYKYDYIGVFDIDEVIMPLGNVTNWNDLIKLAHRVPDYERDSSKCKDWVSFCFRNVYFPRYVERPKVYKQLPSFYYMLQHVERVAEHCDRYSATKCLHSTKYAVGLHNHFPLHRAETGECAAKSVPIEFAQLQHYREPDNKTRLINPIIDDSIWRFQPKLQQRVYGKYKKLGFLPNIHDVEAAEERRIHNDEQQLRKAISITNN